MQHEVGGERQACLADATGSFELLGVPAFVAADPFCFRRAGILEAQLNVIDPRFQQFGHCRIREQNAGSNDVGVKIAAGGMSDQLREVAPRHRFAAREMHLKDADLSCLVEDAPPILRGQLILWTVHRERIGAIGALQGAAMG